jgi:hypothetical protein
LNGCGEREASGKKAKSKAPIAHPAHGPRDIRPYVYWHETGRMAIQFRPAIKFTRDPKRIEEKEKGM